jgi:hypothetical protein
MGKGTAFLTLGHTVPLGGGLGSGGRAKPVVIIFCQQTFIGNADGYVRSWRRW